MNFSLNNCGMGTDRSSVGFLVARCFCPRVNNKKFSEFFTFKKVYLAMVLRVLTGHCRTFAKSRQKHFGSFTFRHPSEIMEI